MKRHIYTFLSVLYFLLLLSPCAYARTEQIKVHSKALEGNLEGNSADREVFVFLPPNYDQNTKEHFPVVYLLHGYLTSAASFEERMDIAGAVNSLAEKGHDMIVVVPDSFTKYKGGFYSSSPTVGNFEDFIARDLPEFIDKHYRTIAAREGRGIAGHSMGGYGTLRIAMKHPEVFSSAYASAPCCLLPSEFSIEQLQRLADLQPSNVTDADFSSWAMLARFPVWTPDPKKAPDYFDLGLRNGKIDPLFQARINANSPLVLLPQYIPALKSLKSIAIEVGDKDSLLADATSMHEELDRFGISHIFRIYDGDHTNHISQRIRNVIFPFLAEQLSSARN